MILRRFPSLAMDEHESNVKLLGYCSLKERAGRIDGTGIDDKSMRARSWLYMLHYIVLI